MRVTKEGIALVQEFKSCALTAYQDQGGRWTIGWGRARGVQPGETCTQKEADAWLRADLLICERLVINCMPRIDPPVKLGRPVDETRTTPELTDNQLSALVSFCYNVGLGYKGEKDGFRTLKSGEPSTMLLRLRAGDFDGAASEFLKWDKVGGVVSAGIFRRRLAEQALFLRPDTGGGGHAKD